MQQPLQPLFQKGDKVVFVKLDADGQGQHEICTVDDIILGDCIIYYKLQELSEVVMENELMPLEDVATIEDEEQFIFTQNFDYDDEVYVEGYDDDVYVVKGVIIEIFRYKDEEWTEVSYELERDNLCIYAYDEDMSLVSEAQLGKYINSGTSSKASYTKTEQPQLQARPEVTQVAHGNINILLDDYNDYIALYQLFGDIEYKELAESVIDLLKRQNPSTIH